MTVNPSTLVDARWYVWADTSLSARKQVGAYLNAQGLKGISLRAVRTGVTRPQGYEYAREQIRTGVRQHGKDVTVEGDTMEGTDLTGKEIGAGSEASDKSLSRWRVDVAA